MDWKLEEKSPSGNPLYWIGEHPSGAELHVFLAFTREPSWGFDPGPEVPAGWYFEIKGPQAHLNTTFMTHAANTEAAAKVAAVEYLEDVIEDYEFGRVLKFLSPSGMIGTSATHHITRACGHSSVRSTRNMLAKMAKYDLVKRIQAGGRTYWWRITDKGLSAR